MRPPPSFKAPGVWGLPVWALCGAGSHECPGHPRSAEQTVWLPASVEAPSSAPPAAEAGPIVLRLLLVRVFPAPPEGNNTLDVAVFHPQD